MAYKDKDKQKEAQRERTRRYRDKQKGVTSDEGVTLQGLPDNFGQPDCQCKHCQQNRRSSKPLIINHSPNKTWQELMKNEVNRVSLPGDVDYKGVGLKHLGLIK